MVWALAKPIMPRPRIDLDGFGFALPIVPVICTQFPTRQSPEAVRPYRSSSR